MKKVRIGFEGFWPGFDAECNFITKIVSKHFEVEFSGKPDFVFASCFNAGALQHDAVRILYTGENMVPDFTVYDYGIGFSKMTFGDRYLRFPLYHLYYDSIDQLRLGNEISDGEWMGKKFCAMVVSNPQGRKGIAFLTGCAAINPAIPGGSSKIMLGGQSKTKRSF